jgi:hypothetical protein
VNVVTDAELNADLGLQTNYGTSKSSTSFGPSPAVGSSEIMMDFDAPRTASSSSRCPPVTGRSIRPASSFVPLTSPTGTAGR